MLLKVPSLVEVIIDITEINNSVIRTEVILIKKIKMLLCQFVNINFLWKILVITVIMLLLMTIKCTLNKFTLKNHIKPNNKQQQ